MITTPQSLEELVKELIPETGFAVDTEFIRENTFYPKMALIQVATRKKTWLIDPTVLTKEQCAPFIELLVSPKHLKIMHASYADQECFYYAYNMVARPVLDTSIAAALCGLGDNIGLARLLKEQLGINLTKGRARTRWLARPLPQELLAYAEQDVAHLVELGETLRRKLEKNNRFDWALLESQIDEKVFEQSPEDMARRIAKSGQLDRPAYGTLVELIRHREDRAKSSNIPRHWVLDNEILIALARTRPKRMEELKSFRGINARELEKHGAALLKAVEVGSVREIDKASLAPKPFIPTEAEIHLVDFIQTYISFLAAESEVASRFLLSSDKTLALLRSAHLDKNEWVNRGILTSESCRVIGDELAALLAGQRALGLKDGKVVRLELNANR